KCRSDRRHGDGRPHGAALGRGQPAVYGRPIGRQRRRRGSWRGLEGAAHDAAVGRARRGRFSGDPPGGNRGHHHCRLDLGRALAPVDLAIAPWKAFAACRQSWQRLNKLLTLLPQEQAPMPLPAPRGRLTVESASGAPPGSSKPVLQDVSFKLERGSGLGVIGPTGSGKSSLARLLVGVWQPVRGKVRLDGCTFDQWSSEVLGTHIGYLPQDVELLGGTVAQNIARFEPKADPQAIVAAAKAAGVHDLITELGEGYETHVGERGETLSAGQAQRIALARAL